MISTGENSWFVYQSSLQSYKKQIRRNMINEIMNLPFEISLFLLQSYFLHAVKSYDMGPMASHPPKGRHAVDFYHP
jgi:hypothetical protein